MNRALALLWLSLMTTSVVANAQTIQSVVGHSAGDGYPPAVAKLSPAAMGCVPGGQGLIVGDERAFQLRAVDLRVGGTVETYPLAAGNLYAGVAVAADGTIYATDPYQPRVWRMPPGGGPATVYAGTGAAGFSGDGGPATAAALSSPTGLTLDVDGNLFVADTGNQRVRRVDAVTKVIATYAGGNFACPDGRCDGGPPTQARLALPMGLAVNDSTGDLYITERLAHRVRVIRRATWTIHTYAGTGAVGLTGDGGPATAATLTEPSDVAVGPDGTVYIADTRNHAVRRVRTSGVIDRLAGTGQAGAGADGPAATSRLDSPRTVEWCGGKLWVGEQGGSQRVRAIDVGLPIPTPTAAWTPIPPPSSTPQLTATRTATETARPSATRTMTPTQTQTATPTCGCCNQCG